MNPATSAATRQLINQAAMAIVATYVLTTVHHLYGGIVDSAANRLAVPVFMAIPLLMALGLLFRYRQTGGRLALIAFSLISVLAFVILSGVLHGGYAHLYKDLLFLLDGPPELYVALNPDEHYPPDNLFFEITGVLETVTAFFVARFTYRLIRHSQKHDQSAKREMPLQSLS